MGRVTHSDIVGLGLSIAIPLVCMGARICGWDAGGTRSRVAASTLAGVIGACVVFMIAGTFIDLGPYLRAFGVALIGLTAGTTTLGRRRLDLA